MQEVEYFETVEAHFQACRGDRHLLSPEDWALLKTWQRAGIPLRAVLHGIDQSFDKWRRDRKWPRRINGLSFCATNVLKAAERMKAAMVGSHGD